MIAFKRLIERSSAMAVAIALSVGIMVPALTSNEKVFAGQLNTRKITLNSSSLGNVTTDVNGINGAAGGYYNGAQTTHTLNFSTATAGTIQSLAVMYCTSPLPQTTCTAPAGMDAATITSITTTGFAANTWTVDSATNATTGYFGTGQCTGRSNCVLATQTTGTSTAASSAIQINIGVGPSTNYIKNPTTAGSYYVRIALFSTNNYATGNLVDQGTVAFSVNSPIEINSAVQESLAFSVSPTAPAQAGTPTNCPALAGGGLVNLGNTASGTPIVDMTAIYNANSWWRLSTNAAAGTTVAYSGDTLKTSAGAAAFNTFANNSTVPAAGTEFFGLNLDTAGTGSSLTSLTAAANYSNNARYVLNPATATPTVIASAANGTSVPCDTGVIKYGATAGATTKAGMYKTQLVYYAIPTF